MDKIKPYLAMLRKHHFWLLAVVLLLLSGYAWYSGTAAYDAEFAENKAKVAGAFSQVEQIANSSNPPNASFAEALKEFQTRQTQSTLSAWQTLYDQQKGILVWLYANDRLASLKPEEEIPEDGRRWYLNYFSGQWPDLFQKVQPLRQVEAEPDTEKDQGPQNNPATQPRNFAGPARGLAARAQQLNRGDTIANRGQTQRQARIIGIVDWPESDRDNIRTRYVWQQPPTSTQVRVAQEDYWIYKALVEIIAETNKSSGATNNRNAAIKRIERLAIAQEAALPHQPNIDLLPKEALPAADSQNQPKPITAKSTDEELLAGRYATPDAGAGDAGAAPQGGGGAEFKLVPVLMKFLMDERRIPNLLVACANSPLTVEVQQVIYNPSATGSQSSSSSRGTLGMPRPQIAAPAATNPGQQVEVRSEADFYVVPVEVRGVVYIFNRPSKAALGLPEEPQAEESMPPVPAAPAVAAPAAATAPTEPSANPAADAGQPSAQPAEAAAGPAGGEGQAAQAAPAPALAGQAAPGEPQPTAGAHATGQP
jgi:hypothetical protein